jgi:hypothetical protein
MDALRKARREGLTLNHIATMRAYIMAMNRQANVPSVDALAHYWFHQYTGINLDDLARIIVPDMDWTKHRIVVGDIRPLHGRKYYQSSQEEVRWTWK